MSLLYSLFKMKKILIILLLLLSVISLSLSKKLREKSIETCEYGKKYIKGECLQSNFNMIPEVYIDNNGIYKYIQIDCGGIIFIRGRKDCKYHKNIYNKFLLEVKNEHLDTKMCKVLGGGRINKSEKDKKIIIYGYSNRYGRAVNQHQITKEILSKYYRQDEITWSNEGY